MNNSNLPEQSGNLIRQQLSNLCQTPVEISLRLVEILNIGTYFNKKNNKRIFIRYGSLDNVFFITEFNQAFLIFLLNRQLGFELSFDRCNSNEITLSSLERRSLNFLLAPMSQLADIIIDENKIGKGIPLEPQILAEQNVPSHHLESENYCAMIYECAAETSLSTISILIPLRFLKQSIAEDLEQKDRIFQGNTIGSIPAEEPNQSAQEICVKIGQVEFPFAKISQLKRGDMIPTSLLSDTLFIVEVDGIPRFKGRPGLFEGSMAVELISQIG